MYIGIKSVVALSDYKLFLTFDTNEEKIFDMKKHLDYGMFKELKDEKLFKTVHISFDSIEWENGADIDPEILYNESEVNKLK